MKSKTTTWLWVALVICVATTIMNASMGRIASALVALISIYGLCLLLFKHKKSGFQLMCGGYVLSFIVGTVMSISSGTGVLISVVMSLIGSSLIPVITALFLKGQWDQLN